MLARRASGIYLRKRRETRLVSSLSTKLTLSEGKEELVLLEVCCVLQFKEIQVRNLSIELVVKCHHAGNDEREQTLNQLLTEMDGFEGNMGIIVMAATNRADVLDTALLRPGRFDRRVTVGLPDFRGRIQILKVHAQGKPFAEDVNLDIVARRTPGFSGAALQNLLNEAAICAARNSKTSITQSDIDSALERIMLGAEKKHSAMPEDRRRLVAYHEAGHAIVGSVVPDYDAVHKISIIPRGSAGGLTFFAPDENRV